MKSKRLVIFAALVILIVPVLAACGPAKVDAALTTYKITLDKDSAPAGEITFHVHNDATDLTHEFVVFKTDFPADQLPLNDEGIVDEEAGGAALVLIDEVEDVEPGMSKDLTVNLEAGNYVLICNIDSDEMHYSHGMFAPFNVK
jgi:uncharacterized cupredoxin-like copper-binding protein